MNDDTPKRPTLSIVGGTEPPKEVKAASKRLTVGSGPNTVTVNADFAVTVCQYPDGTVMLLQSENMSDADANLLLDLGKQILFTDLEAEPA